jgi:hypothetical protein
MDLWLLRPGHKVRTREGTEAEVLSETEDGDWIRVRYLDAGDDPLFSGTEDLAHRDEVEALLGVAQKSTWGDEVKIILHHVPESEESEEGYEAVTVSGIPFGTTVTCGDPDSAEGALNCLLNALRSFGFSGRVVVDDTTYIGGTQRYEVDLAN